MLALRATLLRRPLPKPLPLPLPLVRRYAAPPADDVQAGLQRRKSKRRMMFERTKDPTFVDRVFMFASAGTGGDGAVSFSRDKGLPIGPPGGGNGSRGGSVYVQVDADITSLGHIGNVGSGIPRSLTAADEIDFAEQTALSADDVPVVATVRAPDGEHGKGSDLDGKRVPDRIVRVPPGTVVKVKYLHPTYLAKSTLMIKSLDKLASSEQDAANEADEADGHDASFLPEPTSSLSEGSASLTASAAVEKTGSPVREQPQELNSSDTDLSQLSASQLAAEEAATKEALSQVEAQQQAHEERVNQTSQRQQVTKMETASANAKAEADEEDEENLDLVEAQTVVDRRRDARARYEDELIYKGFFAKTMTGCRPPLSMLEMLAPTLDRSDAREKVKLQRARMVELEKEEAERLARKEAQQALKRAKMEAFRARQEGKPAEDPSEAEDDEEDLDEDAAYWDKVERKQKREYSKTAEAAAERAQHAAEHDMSVQQMSLFWRFMPRGDASNSTGEGLGDLIMSGWQQRTFYEAEERAGRLLLQQRHERLRSHLERVRSYRAAAQAHAAQMAVQDPRRAIKAEEHMAAWDFVIDLNDVATADRLADAGGSLMAAHAAGAVEGQRSAPILLAQGGMGGMGNVFFYSGRDRSPKVGMRGADGEVIRVMLELKSAGDVGLVGFPNAGKSTLLQALTGADGENGGRVGGWAFTTLNPSMGILRLGSDGRVMNAGQNVIGDTVKRMRGGTGAPVALDNTPEARSVRRIAAGPEAHVETDEHDTKYRRLLAAANDQMGRKDVEEEYRVQVADLPGLIEGASDNIGLGHSFLQHVERAAILVFVVNLAAKDDEPPAWEALRILFGELETYQPGLATRATMVIANKADQLDRPGHEKEARATLQRLKEEALALYDTQVAVAKRLDLPTPPPMEVIPVAAKYRLNVDRVARTLCEQHKGLARQQMQKHEPRQAKDKVIEENGEDI